jgi:adenosylcobinamide kinase / adenosylcobinamide-phosphate guanylyltransferase
MGMITLITGGARSGKSGYAETLATQSGLEVVYLATARAGDTEMEERIRRHRARRPAGWLTVEEPIALGAALRMQARAERCIVIDCLTLWLTNLILAEHSSSRVGGDVAPVEPGPRFAAERVDLLEALRTVPGQMIAISNEVGMGVVPLGALNRFFVDETGRLNQDIAASADKVVWMVAGCPVLAKGGR